MKKKGGRVTPRGPKCPRAWCPQYRHQHATGLQMWEMCDAISR